MAATAPSANVLDCLQKFWGYDTLRPLQADAIDAGLNGRDSLVVMPTGGGKSLCYQLPPIVADRTDVVISPLIALMKDQVDGLKANGIPAAAVYSGISVSEMQSIADDLLAGRLRLLFTAPERVLSTRFVNTIRNANIRAFAIDEAHCISHWGHDFRPEYRRLAELKQIFPNASRHAFTATATKKVRDDIIAQLKLTDPITLVGDFDRPNLTYRVVPRRNRVAQIKSILRRHQNEAVIIYCISRRDTESLAADLQQAGFNAAFYHAGLNPDQRRRTQDDFAHERIDIIVATVAFGMGIDRSDVRCVIHAAMPKSIEHYQQESGRAGRDGLPAECVLLYSDSDPIKWEDLIRKSVDDAEFYVDPKIIDAAVEMLEQMRFYARNVDCRHRSLVEYFGQSFKSDNCGACDVCLDESAHLEDATVLAQKILSCVARVEERFGVGHLVDVLKGADTERIRSFGHDKLSTYALLAEMDKDDIKKRIYDLIGIRLLSRAEIESNGKSFPVITLNDASWQVMRGERSVMLPKLEERTAKATRHDSESWEGVDRGLFEALRKLRKQLADDANMPTFVIFNDATLRDLARQRPIEKDQLLSVHGIGRAKVRSYGDILIEFIRRYCDDHAVKPKNASSKPPAREPRSSGSKSAAKNKAFEMFADGASVAEVADTLNRAASTSYGYLVDYILLKAPDDISAWVDEETYGKVAASLEEHGTRGLKPAFQALEEKIPYETIKVVAAHWEMHQ